MTNNSNTDQQYPSWEHDPEIHGYWVVTGRLLATEYPGAKDEEKALRKLQVLRGYLDLIFCHGCILNQINLGLHQQHGYGAALLLNGLLPPLYAVEALAVGG